jgi:hypothetical protein
MFSGDYIYNRHENEFESQEKRWWHPLFVGFPRYTPCHTFVLVFYIRLRACVWYLSVGLRGCTADVIILEEAAFIDPKVFNTIVAPLIGVDNTAVLAISTPDDELGYYCELMNSGLFRVLYLGADCSACDRAGVKCIHKLLRLPKWKTAARQKKIEQVIKDQNLLDRETRGKINSGKNFVFEKAWIQHFVARAPHKFLYPVQVIHTAIDPAAGAESSDYAIGSMAYENSMKVVSREVTTRLRRTAPCDARNTVADPC